MQVVSERVGLPGSMVLDANTVRTVLSMLQGPKIDNDAWVHDVSVEEDDEGLDITVTIGAEERPNVPISEAKQDIYARLGARPDAMVRVNLQPAPHPAHRGPDDRRCRATAGRRSLRPPWPSRSR